METKHIESKRVIAGSFTTTFSKMNGEVNPFIENLMTELESAGYVPAGPMEFIYKGATNDPNKEFQLEVAQPVNGSPSGELNNFELKQTPILNCVSHSYVGPMDKIMATYDELFGNIQKEKLVPTDEVREVYHNWVSLSSEENIVEIQVGIQNVYEPVG